GSCTTPRNVASAIGAWDVTALSVARGSGRGSRRSLTQRLQWRGAHPPPGGPTSRGRKRRQKENHGARAPPPCAWSAPPPAAGSPHKLRLADRTPLERPPPFRRKFRVSFSRNSGPATSIPS